MNSYYQMRNVIKDCVIEPSPYCDGGCRRDDVLEMAKAVLSIPQRNCDTDESVGQRTNRFKSEVCAQYDNDWSDSRTQCGGDCINCVMKWMESKMGDEYFDDTKRT